MDPNDLIPNLRGLPILSHIRDLAIVYALAFVIGWNREREERSAGLRTFPLVGIASCSFILIAEKFLPEAPNDSAQAMARIVEGVITGMGFIGGGAILKSGGEVHGTATAASLWATGAMGVAVGLGAYDVALLVCAFSAMTLYFIGKLKPQPPPID